MKSIHILLVEDNEGDILLTTEAFDEGKIVNQLTVVRDGKQAIDFINKSGRYVNEQAPDLILLDINLPRINGHEVLQYIKTSEEFKLIPVIMLTTSSTEKDIHKAYQNLADFYITKPVEVKDLMNAIASIEDFHLNIEKYTLEEMIDYEKRQ
jgi:CheY-like chemotaxis protein